MPLGNLCAELLREYIKLSLVIMSVIHSDLLRFVLTIPTLKVYLGKG